MSTPTIEDIQFVTSSNAMKSRAVRCIKFFLTLFNIIGILFGLILMVVCIIKMREKKSETEEQADLSRGVLSFLLTVSIALVVTDVLGCIGTLREHARLLYVHVAFFIFLVIVEFVVGVGGAMLHSWIGPSSDLRVQFYKNTTIEDETARYHAFWDELQYENQCCGVDGPQDYSIIHRDIPASCCARAHPLREGGARRHLHSSCLSDRTYYMLGCEQALRIKKAYKAKIFVTFTITFILLEIICISLAMWMTRLVWTERRLLQANLQAHFES